MWNAGQRLDAAAYAFEEFEEQLPGLNRGVRHGAYDTETPEASDLPAQRRDCETESDELLAPVDELRILESAMVAVEHEGVDRAAPLTPIITGVAHLECPTVMGEIGALLAVGEEIHVFDALTGEELGAARVNYRLWTLEDPRSLSRGQVVVYVARLVDAEGESGELSNACEFVCERRATRVHAAIADHLESADPEETSAGGQPSNVALITQVTSHSWDGTVARKRFSDTRVSRCRRIINGTLSEPLRAGESVHVFDGPIDLGCALVEGNSWTFCDARILRATWVLTYTAQIRDRAGNFAPSSSIYMMTAGEAQIQGAG